MTQATRGFLSIMVFLVLATVAAPISVAAADVEIANPGFEKLEPSGAVTGWRLVTEISSDGASFGGEGEVALGGVGSARLAVNGHGTITVESDPVQLEVGELYRLSGWIRTEGAVSDPMSKYPTAVPACLTMKEQPFTITRIRHDGMDGSFTSEIKAPAELAQRMYEFCPDIVDQGTMTVERLATSLEKERRLYFWWD